MLEGYAMNIWTPRFIWAPFSTLTPPPVKGDSRVTCDTVGKGTVEKRNPEKDLCKGNFGILTHGLQGVLLMQSL